MSSRKAHLAVLALGSLCGSAASAADAIPYPNPYTENPATYTFTAANEGEIFAYFDGKGSAGLFNTLTTLINGVQTSTGVLDNQTSAIGDMVDLGHALAGQTLVFQLTVKGSADPNAAVINTWSSVKAANLDGANHVYATAFSGNGTIPAGVYVGFEDLPKGSSDFNYADETFVLTNVNVAAVPEPESYAMMMAGLAVLGVVARRRMQR